MPDISAEDPGNPNSEPRTDKGRPNRVLIGTYNALRKSKPHFTVPKIKYAITKNLSRIEQALEPFHRAEADLREEFGVPERASIRGENGGKVSKIDDEFYERRQGLLNESGEPYESYKVSEDHLDNEEGLMPDGSKGMPDGIVADLMWLFAESK